MALRGDLSSIKALKSRIATMPTTVAHDVAQRAAPAMTALTTEAFASGKSVYGDARPEGADGHALTLRKSGATERSLKFVANGTVVRCVLGPKYAKYLIGKYSVLPNGSLPAAWSARLRDLVASVKVLP